MTGTGDAGQTRLPGRASRSHRREHDTGHHSRRDDRHADGADEAHDEPDDELDAVNRLMGFLRRGSEP
jgi:hypothetical protein